VERKSKAVSLPNRRQLATPRKKTSRERLNERLQINHPAGVVRAVKTIATTTGIAKDAIAHP
jgi:hypothetical protein